MTPLVTRYPLDPTGRSPDNLVMGERHTMPRRRIRAIATQYGAFFTESLKVTDAVTNLPLVKGEQFYATELYELPSARYGKEICAIVIITDTGVSDEVLLEYQALGGEFSNSMTAIVQQIERLNLDERPVAWGNILGRPDEFPPSHHLHDAGDVYGFEYLVHAVDRVRAAILMGDDISHDVIYRYIDMADDELRVLIYQEQDRFNAHINDRNNPHQVTPEQLNVYVKTAVDQMLASLNTSLTSLINGHTSRRDNPHQVTAAQLGVYTKAETNTLITQTANTAAANLQAHTSRTDNPHNVTAEQLNVYLKSAVDQMLASATTQLNDALTAHVNRTDNPHATTKAQVGLGSVQNYGIASQAQAEVLDTTAVNTAYMTPLRVNNRMALHAASGDHDARYVRLNTAVSASLRESAGQLQAYVNGAWRVVWPPQWQ